MTNELNCYHCGDQCDSDHIKSGEHVFCCNGCKMVFEILSEGGLENYYSLENSPGVKVSDVNASEKFSYLDEPEFQPKFLSFKNEEISKVVLNLPQIHCSSCIWLLEHLSRLNTGVQSVLVNFNARRADITFKHDEISLRGLVELLTSIGYEPDLSDKKEVKKGINKRLLYQLGVAGFCFGNIMLFYFPEYLGIDESFQEFKSFFGYISLGLSIPLVFFSGSSYLKSSLLAIKQRYINIDIPIALGIVTLFMRSAYEILFLGEMGYLDSLAGLLFFLLLGKWFQDKTYRSMSFDRDYKSYFPIAVRKLDGGKELNVKLGDLEIGDRVQLRNLELVPADGILQSDVAYIDYSFVTGESELVKAKKGDLIYAGGKQNGGVIELILTKRSDNSYLTNLWNQSAFSEERNQLNTLSDTVSKYFTIAILLIGFGTALYWGIMDASKVWNAVTAVLIVACPCALALSIPFAFGNTIRILGKNGLYLKNANVVERLAKINHLVFDKTGTITHKLAKRLLYRGEELTAQDKGIVEALTANSVHPLSMRINEELKKYRMDVSVSGYQEIGGKGLQGVVNDSLFKIGSVEYTGYKEKERIDGAQVVLQRAGKNLGSFVLNQSYREGVSDLMQRLQGVYKTSLLSGDNDSQESYVRKVLNVSDAYFNQSPNDKLEFVKSLQNEGDRVLMIGDGLNDAGALQQSNVGLAVADNSHQFSPACDGILQADGLQKLDEYLKFTKWAITTVYWSFALSFLYNVVGLSFAVSANLSPIVAAILMPVSSISVVLLTTLSTNLWGRKFREVKK